MSIARVSVMSAAAVVAMAGLPAAAQVVAPGAQPFQRPVLRVPLPPEVSTLYATGEQVVLDQNEERWRPMCFNQAPMSLDELRAIRAAHEMQMAGEIRVVDSPRRSSGLNVVFNLGSSVPADAVQSFQIAEAYLESMFGDPITVTVSVSFASMGSGVLGATGSNYVSNRSYSTVRDGLVNGMDSNDTIQAFLPAGSTVPVRYNGNSATVTNESLIDVTRANYKATIGTTSGADGQMQYNTNFNFDYDPSNGITGSRTSLVDVIIHEVGHALGFVSAADNQSGGQMELMDLFRFQRTDGANNYNPDTLAQFTTTPRLVDYNTPNDDHNSDLISAEYRMSDGTPYQASHFREQSGSSNIGLMDPAIAGGQTYYPNYFKAPDLAMFDAMGYDYPAGGCVGVAITDQPDSQSVCVGGNVTLTVQTTGTAPTFEWRKNFVVIPGETSNTLTLTNVTAADAGNYTVTVNNDCSSPVLSSTAVITVNAATAITDQPDALTVNVGDPATFTVTAVGANLTYQWRKNAAIIPGATSSTFTIPSVTESDEANYTVQVGGSCGTVLSAMAFLTVNDVAPPCAADYNGDAGADILDFLDFMDDFGSCEGQATPCGGLGNPDVNGDNVVDILDFLDFLDAFGQGC